MTQRATNMHLDGYALLGTPELQVMLGVTRVTVYRWVRDGAFPPPDKVLSGVRARKYWKRATVEAWIDSAQQAP